MLAKHAGISSSLIYWGETDWKIVSSGQPGLHTQTLSLKDRQTEDSESSMIPYVICRILEVEQDYRARGSLRQHRRHC